MKKVIITIPAYNEEKTLGKVLDEITLELGKTKYPYKILVVNDGSKDQTVEIAKKHGALVHSNPRNLGLAETFKVEMQKCIELGAEIIVHTDADGQYLASDIPRLLQKIDEGYDLVLGSRFKSSITWMPWLKQVGNKAFAKVFSRLLKVKITDTTTGFRAFTVDVAKNISFINTFTYTQEQLIRAAKQRFKITEIGIITRATRPSHLFNNPLEYALKAWINILRIYRDFEPIKFFGIIGLIFCSGGFAIGIWLLSIYLRFERIGHIPLTILSGILLLMGIQIILFGFLADMLKR